MDQNRCRRVRVRRGYQRQPSKKEPIAKRHCEKRELFLPVRRRKVYAPACPMRGRGRGRTPLRWDSLIPWRTVFQRIRPAKLSVRKSGRLNQTGTSKRKSQPASRIDLAGFWSHSEANRMPLNRSFSSQDAHISGSHYACLELNRSDHLLRQKKGKFNLELRGSGTAISSRLLAPALSPNSPRWPSRHS